MLTLLKNGQHWVGEGAKHHRNRPQAHPPLFETNLFYETKNDMGLKKTYFRAPEAYNHASKIAGHILRFLREGAEQEAKQGFSEVVVTVPASFQLNQRRDTLLAAKQAELNLGDHQLLDEPISALIAYLFDDPDALMLDSEAPLRTLVFDFGGGTCDVAIVEIQRDPQTGQIAVAPLSVSRYHRLGGGDIDAAIVHEHLLPCLLRENHLQAFDLSWGEKKRGLEPQLLGTAELLKIDLCTEIERLKQAEKYLFAEKANIVSRQPALTCYLNGKPLLLSRPTLNAQEWEQILAPFLDPDRPYALETEFRLTQSLFAPLQDALLRAQTEPEEVGCCLLVGGSALIPQVADAITGYLPKARLCMFEDALAMQTAVARSAAWHAFYLAVVGEPLVRPILHEGIALVTGEDTLYPLIATGEAIPFPANGIPKRLTNLALPETPADRIKIQIVAQKTRQVLLNETWILPENALPGDAITLEYALTAAQEFVCRVFLTAHPESVFERTIENPLCNIVNPNQARLQIEQIEEILRQHGGGTAEERPLFLEVARLYAGLGQQEKALEFLRRALRLLGKPDAEIMNLQGLYYGDIRDYKRQEEAFRAADQAAPKWAGPLFNLALAYRSQKRHAEALEATKQAIEKDPLSAPYYVLKGLCHQALEQEEEALEEYETAVGLFGTPASLPDWELGWLLTCAEALHDNTLRYEITRERQRRASRSDALSENLMAPIVKPEDSPDEDYFIF
jgi:tetratricopeptide (TPR) repeat protein